MGQDERDEALRELASALAAEAAAIDSLGRGRAGADGLALGPAIARAREALAAAYAESARRVAALSDAALAAAQDESRP